MKARLVRIGNSRGIRLPKAVIDQAGIDDEVELEVRENQIIISETSYEKIKESFSCNKVGEVNLKNKANPLIIYEVMD